MIEAFIVNTFWLHKDKIKELKLSIGFKIFSVGHLLWLIGIALFSYLTGKYYMSLDADGKREHAQDLCPYRHFARVRKDHRARSLKS